MARLPYPQRETMPAELAELLGSIPRNNITEMLAHATSIPAPWLRLAQAQFTALELSTRQRELVILAVAGLVDCEYEYVQHGPISEAAGIDASLRERVRNGDLDAPDDPAERALLAFVAAVVGAPRVSEEVFAAVRGHLTGRQIVEVLQLVGFYWASGGSARSSSWSSTTQPGWSRSMPCPTWTADDVTTTSTVDGTATATTEVLKLCKDAQNLLFREARTANTFSDEPVSDEQVRAIYDLVKWAPTSMNQQPLRVVLVRSDEARQRLVTHLAEGNRAKTASAPLVAILATDTEFHEHLPRLFPHRPQAKDAMAASDAVRHHNAQLNGALQVAYFILGVRAAGLAAGPMIGFDAEGVDDDFFPQGTIKSLVVVNIGTPGENAWFGRLPRLAYVEVVTEV